MGQKALWAQKEMDSKHFSFLFLFKVVAYSSNFGCWKLLMILAVQHWLIINLRTKKSISLVTEFRTVKVYYSLDSMQEISAH